jgi:glycosyltransferase involved in cell wall biosynthesis
MKILIATGIYPPDIGGPATYSKLLFDELPRRGINASVLSFGEVRSLPKILRHIAYFLKLIKYGKGCDIVLAQDPVSVGLPSLFYCKIFRKKLFVRVAGDYAWEQSCQRFGVTDDIDSFQKNKYGFKVETLRMIQSLVVRKSDKTITPSLYFKRLVSSWNKNDKNRVVTIYNGISLDIHREEKEVARKFLNLSMSEVIIISAGRLVPWKGFELLIEIIGDMAGDISGLKLVILGDGPDRQRLEKKVIDLGLQDKIIMPGMVSREIMFHYLCAGNVFVLNTSFESFSFQIVEAMAVGLPVIATKVGNLDEIISDGNDGILIPYNSREEIKVAILKVLKKSEFRENLSKCAVIKARNFSIDRTVDSLIGLINE